MVAASTGMFRAVWRRRSRAVLGALGGRVIDSEPSVGHADEAFAGDVCRRELERELGELVAEVRPT